MISPFYEAGFGFRNFMVFVSEILSATNWHEQTRIIVVVES